MGLITKYDKFVNEELTTPYDEEPPFAYNQHYQVNYNGFQQEFLQDLKDKLVGKTIIIDGERQYSYGEKGDPLENIIVNGKHVTPLRRIKVKDIVYNGHRQGVYYMDIIDSEDKRYKLKKILPEKAWDKYAKKVGAELEKIEEEKRKKERLKMKHAYHDPYGEENWEEDD